VEYSLTGIIGGDINRESFILHKILDTFNQLSIIIANINF